MNDLLNNGYYIKKNLFKKDECEKMVEWLNKFDNFEKKDYEPNTNIPYIYNNILTENSPFNKIIDNDFLKKFGNNFFNSNTKFSFLKVNNKSKWIGRDICYHQEYATNKYYGLKKNDSLQIFIALEPHTLENGCLKILEKSHLAGEIEHEVFYDDCYNHKLRISYKDMNKLFKSYNLKNCILDPGDCIIFNQFIIHGSASNKSQFDRKAIVGYFTKDDFVFDKKKYSKFWEERHKQTIKSLEEKIVEVEYKLNNFNTGLTLIK